MSILNIFFTYIYDIIAPKKCIICKIEGKYLCGKCFLLQQNFTWFCYICKRKSPNYNIHKKCLIQNKLLHWINFNNTKIYLNKIIVLTHYKNTAIKTLIKKFKFQGKKEIWKDLSLYLSQLLLNNTTLTEQNNSILVPVPLYFIRQLQRWFNQSEIIAQEVWWQSGIPYIKGLIIRRKHTRHQSRLSQEDRLNNLNNAFKIKKKHLDTIDKKTIILIDDVISSWTTLNEIAKILKQSWAKKVIGLCIASD